MPDQPCDDCNKKILRIQAVQSARNKWDHRAIPLLSDAVEKLLSVDRQMADSMMKLIGDLNKIRLEEKAADRS